MADIFIGNVKGPQGDTGATGAQGAQGAQGDAATIAVGSVTTVPYGQNARVTNSGTSGAAVFDFVIPQGRPGEQVTKIDNLTIDAITEPSTQFPVPAVGDNGSTLFGKISKWFSDMAALVATKLNAANVVNNLTTTASGYALDARQGKTLQDQITSLNDSLQNVGALSSAPATWNGDYTLSFQTPLTNYRFLLLIGRYNYIVEAVVLIPTTAALGSRVRVVYKDNFAQIDFNSSGTSATMSSFTGYTDVLMYGVF